ncbi:MAG: hypothetical protein Rpha_1521 [Candidatus Ruthia sp. Apha_13_S6]|nr:hypothetical protein [Candidatus Ruthia sp. Apha_13_S6]
MAFFGLKIWVGIFVPSKLVTKKELYLANAPSGNPVLSVL